MQADRRQAGVLDHRPQLAAPLGGQVGDPRRQGERGDLQAVVAERLDGPADLGEVPALEQLVADSQADHRQVLTVVAGVQGSSDRPDGEPGRLERVAQEHGHGHRADAPGDRRDRRGDLGDARRSRRRRRASRRRACGCRRRSPTAPGLIQSARTCSGRPIAAIRMSACAGDRGGVAGRRVADRDRGVAPGPFWSSRRAIGLPTICDRPSTTACAPRVSISGVEQQLADPQRRARDEPGDAHRQQARR